MGFSGELIHVHKIIACCCFYFNDCKITGQIKDAQQRHLSLFNGCSLLPSRVVNDSIVYDFCGYIFIYIVFVSERQGFILRDPKVFLFLYFENSSVMNFQQIRLLVGVYLGGRQRYC